MCRTPKEMSRHHRKPRSTGGTDDAENISVITRTQHEAWHTLFANYSPERIAEIINTIFLDPAFEFVAVRKESEYDSRPMPEVQGSYSSH